MLKWLWAALISPYTAIHDLVGAGGPAVFWILVASITMWTIVIERYWYFRHVLPQQADGMLRQWQARQDHRSWYARQIRQAMISRLAAGMTANLQLLRVLVPLCPLLGLLGTVTGMLEVFDAMSARGSADARTMASGVSQAMVCTLSGLAVSITGLYPVYYFQARARLQTELLADKFAY
ncbi:MAG TPA: MotA/TolQ/ExbB proton channel family protein [Candidatus Binatia bacterium]|nr:MotA/TolQ/ExbB proton channel family protein [Candidatus Binatia bacterium]